MRKVDFFIVGAPKCGTTAIYAYLKEHPQVFMPGWKEPHCFGSDLDFQDQRRPSPEEYQELFTTAKEAEKLGEASVFYLLSERAAAEIKAYNPKARILIMLRNPVDMLYSFHAQRVFNSTEDIIDFETALEAEDDRIGGRRLPRHLGLRQGLYYRKLADFADQVNRYFEHFGREATHVVLFDEFKQDPAKVYRDICRFLAIDENYNPSLGVVNKNKIARIPWLNGFLWKPPHIVRRLGRALVPNQKMRTRLRKKVRRINTVYQPREPLDPAVSERLLHELAPSITRLSELLECDLSHWLPGQTTNKYNPGRNGTTDTRQL